MKAITPPPQAQANTIRTVPGSGGLDGGGRLVFANQLRGIAALCVVVSHLIGVYWLLRDAASTATFSPVQPGNAPAIVSWVTFAWFNAGQFGVAVFFLISGLVIPVSLARHTRGSFLLARILRIYPVYLAALALELAVIAGSAWYWGRPFAYDRWTLLGNALLFYNYVGQPSIDLVNWTLAIELKFYLLMALLMPAIRRGSVWALFGVAVVVVGINTLLALPAVTELFSYRLATLAALRTEPVYIVFMLIGVLFHYRLRGVLAPLPFLLALAGLAGLFVLAWRTSAVASQYPVITWNYAYALALFGTLFLLRRFMRPMRLLDGLATISFPLYLIHSLVGYTLLKLLTMVVGLAFIPALALVLLMVIGLATALNRTVERAGIRAGRWLAMPKGRTVAL